MPVTVNRFKLFVVPEWFSAHGSNTNLFTQFNKEK